MIRFIFTHPNIDRSHETPTEPTLACLKRLLTLMDANAVYVHSDSVGGRISHYCLIATAEEFCAKSHNVVDCVAPTNPGATLNVPGNKIGP